MKVFSRLCGPPIPCWLLERSLRSRAIRLYWGMRTTAGAALFVLTLGIGPFATRVRAQAAVTTSDPAVSRVEDFIRVAASGRDADDLRNLVSYGESLTESGSGKQLPGPGDLISSSVVDLDELATLGRQQRLASGGGLTGYDLCVQAVGLNGSCDKGGTLGYGLCVKATGRSSA